MADRAFIFDNSRLAESPQRLVSFVAGNAVRVADDLPDWAIELCGGDLP